MKVFPLEIKYTFNQTENCIYPAILQNHQDTLLIDSGYAGFLPLIDAAARIHGILSENITGVIITHHDIDHMGGLHEIKLAYPSVKVYTSAIEENYVSGKQKSLRLVQAETLYDSLPDDQKPGAYHFQELLKTMQPVAVDRVIDEKIHPGYFEGLEIIDTPGHMPGHISLYIPENKMLIAADAVVYQDGAFDIANPAFTLDLPEAIRSVKKLLQLDIDSVLCYHGGLVTGKIRQQLKTILDKYDGISHL